MDLQVGGVSKLSVSSTGRMGIGKAPNSSFSLDASATVSAFQYNISGSNGALYWSGGLALHRDAANILAQRFGVNAQTFNIYNTYTSATDYERAHIGWNDTADTFVIGTEALGMGVGRDVELKRNGASSMILKSGGLIDMDNYLGSNRIRINHDGNTPYVRVTQSTGKNTSYYPHGLTASAEYNIIAANGVGIGTATPTAALQVIGNVHAGTGNTGTFSNFIGSNAGQTNSGNYTVGIGSLAMQGNTGSSSIGVGYAALFGNTGSSSVAVGYAALLNNVGVSCVGVGHNAGNGNLSLGLTAVGFQAAKSASGIYRTAIGYESGFQDSGTSNTFVGFRSGYDNVTNNTTGVGYSALQLNTGANATAIGYAALKGNTASSCTAVGYTALFGNTGSSSVAVGTSALNANTGTNCTAVGNYALIGNSGTGNSALGMNTLYSNTGPYNSAIGYQAGRYQAGTTTPLTTASLSVFIGSFIKGIQAAANQLVLGYAAESIGANSVVLGNDSIVTTALKGSVGIGTTAPSEKLDVVGNITASGTVKTTPTTVALLPAAATAGAGARTFVTDSANTLSSHHGQTVAGGGINFSPVFSDGTNWIAG
tara:strand:- start:8378 stop:10165 length:1788 start_codon:yes stop_codon:yes gene_type:complete